MGNKQLHIFDICGTMFQSNTTYDFLLFYFKRNNSVKHFWLKACFTIFAKIIWTIFARIGWSKKVRQFLLSFLKNEPVLIVKKEAIAFADYLFEYRIIPETHLRLNKALQNLNNEVWLVSASIEPVVSAIASHFINTQFLATELEVVNGFYTGVINIDLEKRKAAILREKLIISSDTEMISYTDSMNDSDLVELSYSAFIVCPHNEEQKWRNKFPDHIKLEFSHDT